MTIDCKKAMKNWLRKLLKLVKKKSGKKIIFYSFATKFCSHHNDKDFAIYDRYVEKILMHFKKLDDFSKNFTKKEDLKEYSNFKSILFDFRVYYKLEDCN